MKSSKYIGIELYRAPYIKATHTNCLSKHMPVEPPYKNNKLDVSSFYPGGGSGMPHRCTSKLLQATNGPSLFLRGWVILHDPDGTTNPATCP